MYLSTTGVSLGSHQNLPRLAYKKLPWLTYNMYKVRCSGQTCPTNAIICSKSLSDVQKSKIKSKLKLSGLLPCILAQRSLESIDHCLFIFLRIQELNVCTPNENLFMPVFMNAGRAETSAGLSQSVIQVVCYVGKAFIMRDIWSAEQRLGVPPPKQRDDRGVCKFVQARPNLISSRRWSIQVFLRSQAGLWPRAWMGKAQKWHFCLQKGR